MVHLFEWKWSDIAAACPRLAEIGYCAVQVSPPQEHAVYATNDPPYPWWQRYQPVSYIVTSRSGDEEAFQNMVNTCNAAGVRIYVDAVINHMTAGGSGTGSAGSYWNAGDDYTNIGQDYPSVPYSATDFNGADNCPSPSGNIEDYQSVDQVRNCRLVSLRDLRLAEEYPRDKVAEYLQKAIDWGVAGFRIDAAKHMWPGDLAAIYGRLAGSPFVFHEVIDQGGEPITAGEYTGMGRVTEFKYGLSLSDCVRGANGQKLAYLVNFGEDWGFIEGLSAVVFVDNHDNQRGHGGGGGVLTHKEPRDYKVANAFMLAWPYGYPRVMSSYRFENADVGPPSDGDGNTNDVVCFDGDWICEHEWRQIRHMVRLHNVAVGEPVANWWDNGNMAIAFSRPGKAFVFINKEEFPVSQTFLTGLPPGEYCDVISCDGNLPPCTGSECLGSIIVDDSGAATITISNTDADPIRAYHV